MLKKIEAGGGGGGRGGGRGRGGGGRGGGGEGEAGKVRYARDSTRVRYTIYIYGLCDLGYGICDSGNDVWELARGLIGIPFTNALTYCGERVDGRETRRETKRETIVSVKNVDCRVDYWPTIESDFGRRYRGPTL